MRLQKGRFFLQPGQQNRLPARYEFSRNKSCGSLLWGCSTRVDFPSRLGPSNALTNIPSNDSKHSFSFSLRIYISHPPVSFSVKLSYLNDNFSVKNYQAKRLRNCFSNNCYVRPTLLKFSNLNTRIPHFYQRPGSRHFVSTHKVREDWMSEFFP